MSLLRMNLRCRLLPERNLKLAKNFDVSAPKILYTTRSDFQKNESIFLSRNGKKNALSELITVTKKTVQEKFFFR